MNLSNQISNNPDYSTGLINVFAQLADIMKRKGEPFKSRAYQKVAETIELHDGPLDAPVAQLKGKRGVGEAAMKKITEFVEKGTIALLERELKNPVNTLTLIHGVGPAAADKLVSRGIDSIQDLRVAVETDPTILNDVQKLGLRYHDEIQMRIPREEIDTVAQYMVSVFASVPNAKFEIVGSYRRGTTNSGDIDVIVTNDDPMSKDPSVLVAAMDRMITDGYIVDILSRGKTKSMVVAVVEGGTPRRVDFMYSPPAEYAFAILYFTGSKAFNTVMRHHALKSGYSLNEHGIHMMDGKKKGVMVSQPFPTEESIFEFLGMEMKAPVDRVGTQSLVLVADGVVSEPISKIPMKSVAKNPNIRYIRRAPPPVSPTAPTAPPNSPAQLDVSPMVAVPDIEMVVTNPTTETSHTSHTHQTPHTLLSKFKHQGVPLLESLPETTVADMVRAANADYYNAVAGETVLDDAEYDVMKEYVERTYPVNPVIHEVGAPITKGKMKLPRNMPSMNKIKPDTGALESWMRTYKGPFVITPKLDGVSGMYVVEEGKSPQMFTRGDGTYGQDVSHLIPHMGLPTSSPMILRGEFEIRDDKFDTKYGAEFANARNFVSGVINKTTRDPGKYDDMDFIAYEVIEPAMKPSDQFKFLTEHRIASVPHEVVSSLANELLSARLVDFRENHAYATDGIIVADDTVYPRTPDNPKHAFAFKQVLSDQTAEAKVLAVEWAPSKDGYLKPRVRIEPVKLRGVTIEFVTGFNGKYIRDNMIGVGALLKIVRSGDVIPHIMDVVVPAEEPMMPTVQFTWNATGVDILVADLESNPVVRLKRIAGFFSKLEVDGMGIGNTRRIIDAGYDTIPKIIDMSVEDLLTVEGFKKKLAEKIHTNMNTRWEAVDLATIMSASGVFGRGFGERKLRAILNQVPGIITSGDNVVAKVYALSQVEGVAKKTAEKFVVAIPVFMEFVDRTGLHHMLAVVSPDVVDGTAGEGVTVVATPVTVVPKPLDGTKIVITGFRDKEFEKSLEAMGATVSATVSKNTTHVIVKTEADVDGNSTKLVKARKLNAVDGTDIQIVSREEFVDAHMGDH